MAVITINGISVDPLVDEPSVPSPPDASDDPYILVQTKVPLTREQKDELGSLNVIIHEYVRQNTYLCRWDNTDLESIRTLSYVKWVGPLLIGFKIAPALLLDRALTTGAMVRTVADVTVKPDCSPKLPPRNIDVVFHADVNPEDIRDKVAAAARLDPSDLRMSRHKVRLAIQPRYFPDIAAIPQVRRIEEILPATLLNDVARQIIGLEPPPFETVYEGKGQMVAVADSGFDSGDITDIIPAFAGRVHKLEALGRPGNANDPIGHGTHIAGSVLGDSPAENGQPAVRGTAPKAKLIFQALFGPAGNLAGLPEDLSDLFQGPFEEGARIHNDSWGRGGSRGKYNEDSREVDQFVWEHRDFVICLAAGNEGSDILGTATIEPQTITAPGTAKNCITVGACESLRPGKDKTYRSYSPADFFVDPIASDKMADNPEGMAAFSSRGPTVDQRIKPDLVAPGTFIRSMRSRAAVVTEPHFHFDHGTSMATALVSGCVAVVRECLAEKHALHNPSAALIKAILINCAKDLGGQYQPSEAPAIPNNAEGFGRVDMATTISGLANDPTLILKDEDTVLGDELQEEITLKTIEPQTSLLKVTLVWTDPAGCDLQNDLDLMVKAANGEERHGNVVAGSANFDRVNNVEQVVWRNIPAGQAEIIVRAFRITKFIQKYALVIRTA